MLAKPILNMLPVRVYEILPDGVGVAKVDCESYDSYKRLPSAIEYAGRYLSLSGWNSDLYIAYYRTDRFRGLASMLE